VNISFYISRNVVVCTYLFL